MLKWLLRVRQHPFRRDAGIDHENLQRSRSSRNISSVEGNGPAPGEGIALSASSFFEEFAPGTQYFCRGDAVLEERQDFGSDGAALAFSALAQGIVEVA